MERLHEVQDAVSHLPRILRDVAGMLAITTAVLWVATTLWGWVLLGAVAVAGWRVVRARLFRVSIQGDVAVVTGAAGRMGSSMAIELARRGCRVALIDNDAVKLRHLEATLTEHGYAASFHSYIVDVTEREAVYDAAEQILSDMGRVSLLFPLASVKRCHAFSDCPDVGFLRALDVSVAASFYLCRAFLPGMIDRNRGWVVDIVPMCSVLASTGMMDVSVPNAANTAFIGGLRNEMKALGRGVRVVSCIANVSARYPSRVLPPVSHAVVASRAVEAVVGNEDFVYAPFQGGCLPALQVLPFPIYEFIVRILGLDAFKQY